MARRKRSGGESPPDTVAVRFISDYVVDDYRKGTAEEESYKAGESYELSESSARHFVGRQRAVEVVANAATAALAEQPAPVPDPEPQVIPAPEPVAETADDVSQ